MRAITFDTRAQARTQTRALRAVAMRANPPAPRSIAADAARLAVWLFPAALLFVTVLGV
jgi:hypothetical protein